MPHIYHWENEVIKKFEIVYDVEYFFANQTYLNGGSNALIDKINKLILSSNIEIVVFDTDFIPFIDANIIQSVNSNVFKILVTFDNIAHGVLNLINGSYCDLVLTYDPLDVLKFRENNINALFFTLEDTKNSFKFLDLEKEIDVLFYGDINKFGRKEFIQKLKNRGIDVYVVGPPDNIVSDNEIVELINKSKIVLNLSFSNSSDDYNFYFPSNENELNRPLLQFKGRFLHAGLCKTACISEYAPSIGLIYSNDEVPTFNNVDECINLINEVLTDESKRILLSKNLHDRVINTFDDERMMYNIYEFIELNKKTDSIRKFKYNKFYKKYITRFKLLNLLKSPVLLINESIYLVKNNLFYFSIDFIPFLFDNLKKKFFIRTKSFFKAVFK